MAELQIVVVTPEQTTLDQSCEYIAVPLIDGEAGILPGHAPMMGRLKPGELRVRGDGKEESFYIDGGTLQIDGGVVSILTNTSKPVSQIDLAAAQAALSEAEAMEGGNTELAELKSRALEQARAKIRLASKN